MDEVERIWRTAPLLGFPFGQYIRMLLLTGQRRTEVARMRWADIDRANKAWTIPTSETKADRAQLVPLPPQAMEIIEACPEMGPYVFTTDGETAIANFAKNKSKLDEYIAAKGAVLPPWRLHDLRRTAATHMVRLGFSMEIVGRVLNHAAQGITATTYGLHDYAPQKREALKAWADEVDRASNG